MRKVFIYCFLWLCLSTYAKTDTISVVSYNVENLFDCKHDSLKNDRDFTPEGAKHWTPDKYKQKLANISKVITSIGGWKNPALVGLVEIENKGVLEDLTLDSPLKNLHYKYIHKESPDRRGIDVALLYQPDQFTPIKTAFYEINFPENPRSKTRDILYAAGKLPNGDTIHVFVNHFPSRLGGEKESEEKRIFVASVLKSKVDSIRAGNIMSNILIMGDFNDFPKNKSISTTLGAKKPHPSLIYSNELYNMHYQYQESGKMGTNKYKGNWGTLDQIIVSGSMLLRMNNVFTREKWSYIFQEPFLLEDDGKKLGKKPFRTYNGKKYQAGFSDHLPVYVKLLIK